jgi:hypothetical protein
MDPSLPKVLSGVIWASDRSGLKTKKTPKKEGAKAGIHKNDRMGTTHKIGCNKPIPENP